MRKHGDSDDAGMYVLHHVALLECTELGYLAASLRRVRRGSVFE
jgi:hypothetical protein